MTRGAQRLRAALAGLLAASGLACGEPSEPAQPARSPASAVGPTAGVVEAAGDARSVLVAWLQCGECRDGEFEALRKLGPAAFPLLEAALEHGPAPAALAARRLQLQRSYRSLRAYAAGRREMRIELDEEPYVEVHQGSYVALYRLRAGQGLLALGAPGAEDAAGRALASDLREDARRALRAAVGDPDAMPWR